MMTARPLVCVVDDDKSIRESLPDLLNEFGYSVCTFSSAQEFLQSAALDQAAVLILDIAMPGITGIELQTELNHRGSLVPVIFITANRDKGIHSQVAAQGATACLLKPFSDTDLFEALKSALSVE
jgi:FixJ family two-component response regulator